MNHFFDYNNEQVAKLPWRLRKYIVDQAYDQYTFLDHAVWRYIMRQNYHYLKEVAYYPYIPGLKKAGLTIEKIPSLQEMNDALSQIGWGAVTVDGFIPPAAFMEFQAFRVLVIAADIRQLEHIEYTSAPDIIHESAGHAPIISDTKYNQYLSHLGEIGTKALFSSKDYTLYESIRALSILKETPNVDSIALQKAEELVLYNQQNLGTPSEMALLSRLQWWTVEYGLIGDIDNPKIYGAGLLSSIGESVTCMKADVKKIVYTIDALNYGYDITKQQPQLFITPTFQNLIDVLEQFEQTMAYKVGGLESVLKAIECNNICTATFSSGIQVSGVFSNVEKDFHQQIKYIYTQGPTSLFFNEQLLMGHDTAYHAEGFGSPVGKLKGIKKKLEDFSLIDLLNNNIILKKQVILNFDNGISIEGILESTIYKSDKLVLLSFTNCTVKDTDGKIYFEPQWGVYDMAIGDSIKSVFNGVADKNINEDPLYISTQRTYQQNYTHKDLAYHALFGKIRAIRAQKIEAKNLNNIWENLRDNYKEDWLGSIELLELSTKYANCNQLSMDIRNHLIKQAQDYPPFESLIRDGLTIIEANLNFE